MLSRILLVFSLCALWVVPVHFAYAQVGGGSNADQSQKEQDLAKAQSDALKERVNTVMKRLDEADLTHFMVMYTNYTMYSMVKAVRDDVSGAVSGCAENNPEMADDLNSKFSKWDKNVGDSMKQVDSNIKSLGLAQNYITQNELGMIYDLVDETRAVNSSQFEKTPVTTSEACEFMMSKMDETQENMVRLLAATMQSYPNMLKKTQE
tara:strand:- start:39200 stop:39820 length:621 start_codon:yes stop_codon:yes gene_type:complete